MRIIYLTSLLIAHIAIIGCTRSRSNNNKSSTPSDIVSPNDFDSLEPCSIKSIASKYQWDVAIDPSETSCPGIRLFLSFLTKHGMPVPESIFVDIRDINLSGADGGYVIRLASTVTQVESNASPSARLNAAGNMHEFAHIFFQQELQKNQPTHPYLSYLERKKKFSRLHRDIELLQGSAPERLYAELSVIAKDIEPYKWMMDIVDLPFEELFADYMAARILNAPDVFAELDPLRTFAKQSNLPPPAKPPTEYQYFSSIRSEIWTELDRLPPDVAIKSLLDVLTSMTRELMKLPEHEAKQKVESDYLRLNTELLTRLKRQ